MSAMVDNKQNATEHISEYRLPSTATLQYAAKVSVVDDKPIMMDYWSQSLEKGVFVGVKENKEQLLVKSADEYTSPIVKISKMNAEYIVATENSIYLVDGNIACQRIST